MYRVLLVDDEPMIREGLKILVNWAALNFEVVSAVRDGQEALDWFEENDAELLVTDVRMPKIDGMELVKRLRAKKPELRVVVISSYDEFEYVREMALFGIENYLLKPINEDEFAKTLKNIAAKLDSAKAERAHEALDGTLIRQNIINRWLYGTIDDNELRERAEFLGLDLDAGPYKAVILRFPLGIAQPEVSVKNYIFKSCGDILSAWPFAYCAQNYDGETLAICGAWSDDDILPLLAQCVRVSREQFSVPLLVCVSEAAQGHWHIAGCFSALRKHASAIDVEQYMDTDLAEQQGEQSPFSMRLAQYVLEHYNDELSLKLLAQKFRGNAAYIGQVFKRDMGKSFVDYLKTVRIENARLMLRTTNYSTIDIAQRVGFVNSNYFFTVFKKETGLSPAEYRESHYKSSKTV